MLFFAIAAVIFIIDQTIKQIIVNALHPGWSIPLVGQILKLTYVKNTGAAFSLFVGHSAGLAVIGLVIVAGLIYYHYKKNHDLLFQLGLASLLGGSFGNLFDRLTRGFVVDYIDFGFWPVFNFADIMINIGVAILAYSIIVKGGKRQNASHNC